jgi:hypothetical protein
MLTRSNCEPIPLDGMQLAFRDLSAATHLHAKPSCFDGTGRCDCHGAEVPGLRWTAHCTDENGRFSRASENFPSSTCRPADTSCVIQVPSCHSPDSRGAHMHQNWKSEQMNKALVMLKVMGAYASHQESDSHSERDLKSA